MTALQGLEAPGGSITWQTLNARLWVLCEPLTGPPLAGGSAHDVEAVRLSHQKAVKAGSVVDFVSAFYGHEFKK